MTKHVYLDTHIWNYLVEKADVGSDELASLRNRLMKEVQTGRLAVVASMPLLQELMGTAPNNPAKYEQLRELTFAAVGHRWLVPLNKRHIREGRRAGPSATEPATSM